MYFNRKNAQQKNWRMIKKGKHFLFGCSLVFAIGATLAAPTVKADSVEDKPETTVPTSSESTGESTTYDAPAVTASVEKNIADVATVVSTEAETAPSSPLVDKTKLEVALGQARAKNLDGQEASVKAEVAAAIAEAEALVANESVSQAEINQSVERLNKAVASVKEVTAVTTETPSEETTEVTSVSSTTTPKVRSRRALSEGNVRSVDESRLDRVTVTKDNFDSFFKEGGTANYDETSGTIKLTDDVSGQVGSAYLRFKIDPKEDFTFTGKVDIGDKYEGHKVNGRDGGDGVGFVFHTGKVDTIGQSGASIGMGTIKNAFGFKLDSWHNTSNPNANQNASADPKYGNGRKINGKFEWEQNAFGSFYSSNNAGRVTTSSSAAKALNPKPNGEWVDFKIEYKGQSKEFIVTYGSEKWSTNLKTANASIMESSAKTALNNSNATYALSFLGSTGSGTNLQRVQIEKFEFTAPQIVQVAFYDEAGNELAASSAIPGDRDQVVNLSNIEAVQKAITKIKAKGYTLKEVNSDRAETYNSGANTVTLRSGGQLLKYVFAVPTPEVTKTLPSDGGMLRNGGIKSTDNTLSGTGTPGATINIKVAGNTVVDNVTVESNGKWTATLPTGLNSNVTTQDQLVPKNSLVVTQKIGVSESEAATVDVALGESSVVPSTESKDQQSLVAETTTVTLKVPHDAGIAYFDYPNANNGRSEVAIKRDSIPGAWTSKDESKAVVTSYSSDGFFDTVVLEMKDKIQAGKAKVISNIKETKYSSPVGWKEINVEAKPDTTPPAAPTVNAVKAGATSITGTAEANSTVEATLPNGSKATATAGADGSFTIPVSGLNEGDTISVTATDAANNKSDATTVTVKENVRPTLHIPYDDPATQAIYVYSGEENNIELKVTDNSGKIVKAYLALPQDNRSGLGAEDTTFLNGRTKGGLYLKTEGIHVETTATESTPAIVRVTGEVPKNTYTESNGQLTRYLFAEDAAGNTSYEHVGDATTPGQLGRIRFMWKPQTFKYNAQAPSTPIVTNTVPNATELANAVKAANPTFSDKIDSVTLNGTNVTVTYKDGSTDTLAAASVFSIEAVAPTVTPVKNPSSLTTPEKQAVEAAVRVANPDVATVVVGNDGSTTLTYSNGSTATLTPAQTVKAADANGVQEPAAKTPVQNTSALTQPEKDAVKKAVETANPTATKVEVGDNGDTTVTFPDGTTATLPGDKTVKVADSKGVQEPAAKTPVQNTSALTQPEKDAVKKAVETANPTATKVEVGDNGDTTVTFPDGTTATLPGDKTVKVADSKGVQEPAAKTPVQNTSALTQPEKDAVKKAVETANPTATKVEVGDNGDTTVTFPDGTTATLPGDKTVKVADSKGVQEPAAKTPVQNTSALTQPEKDAVKKAVETANPTATKVEVGDNGDTTVTFPDGTTATLPGDKTVKVADSKGVQEPAAKTPVQNTSALTQPEKDAVKKAVETANPTATKVEVADNGDTTVTFPDGTTATLPGDKTVKVADSKGVQEPAAKTPVQNTSALTQPEKDAVKKAVETANPTATKVEVGDNGDTTVTFPDGTTATLPGDKTVKVADSKGVQEPAAKTPVQNTSALTQPEKDAVKKAVETANPTATKVEVGDNGDTTVTFPDGTTATLPGDKTVKVADSKGVQEPAAKTPVQNTSALTQPEKDAVKKAVETANPTATKVEVGDNGDTTVTFPDGTTATLPGDKTVKVADSKGVQEPAAKTPVQNTSALTQPEKDAVKKAVETANPTATKVEVGDNGDTTVTFPDGTTATLPGDKTVKVADSKGVQEPAAKTPVQNTSALTQPEKDAVKKAVETANPTATKVEVGDNGDTTVTFPDGTTATLPGDKTVKVADSKGVQEPAAKTPVQNTSALTQPEKDAVKKAVETANPTATKVEVGDNGDTTVTFPDGTTATLPGDKTVKVADSKGVQEPAAKTPVQNTSALTQPEKDAVKKAVETANPTATKVEVGDNGDTTVTFPDGTTATLPGDKTVKVADSKGVQEPAAKTPVQNTSALTQPEKDAVKKAVETANPTATKVEVGDNGDTTVTFPDGTTATLPGDKTVKVADSKGVQEPAAKTPVQNTSALTQPEKDAVKKAVETANPTATKVEVGDNGDTTVTFPDGTTATLPGDKTVKVADSKGVQEPAAKTPVQNTSALTQPEKDAVKKAVETANPTATKVEVGDNGDTTVTFPDGTTATLPGDKTVKVADSKGVQEPAAKTPVQNTSALTQPEKDAVKKAVETANPTATKVEVGDNGDTTVTFPDGTTATLPGDKTVKVADSKGVQEPAAKTPVQNTSALTQPEKDAVKKAVETANPTATKVEVGDNGDTTVTFPDGTTATLPGDKTVKVADSKGVQEPAAKTPVQNTSALTQPEKDAVKKAVETANPTATKVEVGDNGDTTVTFPDGTTATLPGDKTVKVADSKGVQEPAAKTPVQNTSALTQPEKDAVKKAVETANPTATKVEVGDNGDTTVTFPDGTTATLPGDKTVKVADFKGVQEPAAKTPVQNTSALTQPEKDAVKKAVETANPTATKVEVGDNGDTTVTFPDGTTATLPGDKTVKVADSKGVQEPAAKTPVQNTSALTQPEKDAVKKAVETANPTATKVEVGDNGDTTVTFPDGTTATLPGDKTVKVADSKGVQEPAAKTPVQNTSALTQPEKDAVKKAVETANPTATKVEVGDNGDTTVTFPDGTTATLPGDKTVKVADSKGVQEPAAKTPVQNTSALTQPEKDAVKKAVETANPTATKVEVGDNGDTTVTFPDGTTATLPGDKTVKVADDKTAPTAPVVNPVKAGDTAITGTAEAGSTVEVTLPNGSKATATADQDGNFSVPVSGLEEGKTVSVTATDASNNTSAPTTATVGKADDKTAPTAPVVNPVKAGDTAITGTAEAGSTVEVTLPNGSKATATADQDGNFSVPVSGLEEGKTVSVTATDASNNTSAPTTVTVGKADDKTAPTAPVVNPVKAGDTAVTGTAEAGSTVEVTLPNGDKVSAKADQDGNFSVPVSGLEEGKTVSVTATDASNNTSAPTTVTVGKADDKTAPTAPVVNPVKAGDTAVTGTAEAGSTVEVTLPNGDKVSAKADQDGNFSVPVSGLEEGKTVSVTATDASNNTSAPTTVTVGKADDKTAPTAPVVNPVKAGDTAVTGTAEAGSTVEVTLPNGDKVSAKADQDGNFSVPVSGLEEGKTVSVTATDASNNTSAPTTVTVGKADDKTAPTAPVVNPVKAGDTAVTGTAEAGSTVEVTLPNGDKVSAKADQDGNFSVPVSGLEEGKTVSVTATDASNNTSAPTTVTVGKADDKTAPTAPVVNPVKAGDTAVTGTAEAGSTVEVTLPNGDKVSAKADQDGNFSVPVSGLEEGKTVSVTATDASNNTSAPTTVTVGKADDKTAPTAPSTKTPVKDTANLTDAEKSKVKEAVEAVNPGSKAEVSTLPNTGEKQSVVALGLAVLSALSGGLLVSKKRKEEE